MPRPANKDTLITLSEENYKKLLDLIDSVPAEKRGNEFDLNERDKTISDVICHLHEWHNMMEGWYNTGMGGEKPIMPAKGFTWQTLPALNAQIYEQYKGTSLEKAREFLQKSHETIMALIEKHSDEELFTRKYYPWTGTTSLGAYFVSSASSHYDWGLKTLKKIRKQLG